MCSARCLWCGRWQNIYTHTKCILLVRVFLVDNDSEVAEVDVGEPEWLVSSQSAVHLSLHVFMYISMLKLDPYYGCGTNLMSEENGGKGTENKV